MPAPNKDSVTTGRIMCCALCQNVAFCTSYGVIPPPGRKGLQSAQSVKCDQEKPLDGLTGFRISMLNMMIKMRPNQNTGIACPTNAK